jgi:hypothetical protein
VRQVIKSREEVGELVLNEMRKHPGCEKLAAIRIVGELHEWFIAPRDRTAQFSQSAQRAAMAVGLAFREKYEVKSD